MKRTRSVQGLALLGALVAVAWFVVLPAIAATGKSIPPASTAGVTPTNLSIGDDAVNDCKVFYSSGAPTYGFRIKDGTSKTYTDPASGATFTLKVNPGNPDSTGKSWPAYANNTYFSFTSTGAAIVDVGVDGADERDAARYNYSGVTGGFVTGDGYLHADAQKTNSDGSTKTLDGLDDMSFCYNLATASVSGTVFRDANKNSANDDSAPLQGWTVNLYKGTTLSNHATTAADGKYTFTVPVSTTAYTICEVPPTASTGWNQTQVGSAACSGSGELVKGYSFQATIAGAKATDDFGNYQTAPISGTAFNDANGDGSSTGDSPLAGLTATLYDGSGNSLGTTTTAADGTYSFGGQVAGNTYRVCISTPSGGTYKQTAPGAGVSCPSGQAANGFSFTLAAAGQTGQNFGFQPVGSISGMVYNDVNQNGSFEPATDATQSGWTVNLYDATGALVKSTTSAADGTYEFDLPLTSAAYTVCEAPPSGDWAQSEPLPSSTDQCSTGTELPKGYSLTGAAEGASLPGKDFGNVQAHSGSTGTIATADGNYQANLPAPKNNNFVINEGTDPATGKPYVSLWAGDSTQGKVPLLEKITFPNGLNGDGTFKYTQLEYTDTFPFDLSKAQPMPACQVDPRDPSNPNSLTTHFKDPSTESEVLPTGATSCLIAESPYVDASGHAFFNADVYSAVDGARSPG
jgi:SdrD B-like domain